MTYNVPTRAVTRSSSLRTSVNIRSFPVRKDGNTQTAERHTSQAFVAFLTDLLTHVARKREVHIICDNRSAHKTNRVVAFLAEHPTVHLHFPPTYPLVAEPGGAVVLQDRTGPDSSRRVHVGPEPGVPDHDVHPSPQRRSPAHPVAIQRPEAAHSRCLTITCYRPLVTSRLVVEIPAPET